ncbi:MAG: hypothetical protein BWX80_03914 [Candidatus Hydrogenedentes bacterium ADurb.Bin101]|nr:MAG: hypothetical protein BWX80_03914 [Candidatus Hydrogenedentes bacterium ADurb.Bin101]
MGGIQVAVPGQRVFLKPFPARRELQVDIADVMQVAAFRMEQVAEHTPAHHVQDRHFRAPIAAVFHHNAVLPLCLGGFHQLPAFLEGDGGGHLGGGVLAVFHGGNAYGHVQFVGRGRVHQVQVLFRAQAFKIAFTLRIARGPGMSRRFHRVLGPGHFFLHNITDRLDFHPLQFQKIIQVVASHVTHADKAYAHPFHRRCEKKRGHFLCRGIFRGRHSQY